MVGFNCGGKVGPIGIFSFGSLVRVKFSRFNSAEFVSLIRVNSLLLIRLNSFHSETHLGNSGKIIVWEGLCLKGLKETFRRRGVVGGAL